MSGKQKTHKMYLKSLLENAIETIPLEKYKGALTPILHKCVCGNNEWQVKPNYVLSGQKCGCGKPKISPKSNNWYLEKLKGKNIKVIPLEQYIKINTKILHRCICNNEWMVSPNNVLTGVKCGCYKPDQNKTNDWYLEKLKEKEIKVIPLEKYIDMKTKILHQCICGNKKWSTTPLNVVNNHLCGCHKRLNYRDDTFYKDKETILYYIKIIKDNLTLYKVGVTLFKQSIENSMKKRFGKELDFIEVLETKVFQDGAKAFLLEQNIINENWKYNYKGVKMLASGNTELFTEDIRKWWNILYE